jgi:hypothetical protein
MRAEWLIGILAPILWVLTLAPALGQEAAQLTPVGTVQCEIGRAADCTERDAIVFVHGIYGAEDTFRNEATGFDWPTQFPRAIDTHRVDVYWLGYRSKLIAWARGDNPSFEDIAKSVFDALRPLRTSGYGSIGFIAHSLGGNIVATYIHYLKTKLGHPQRSQNAFIITLATPVLGAQIADLASILKASLLMSDPLLESLKAGNLYLSMLEQFRELEEDKERRYSCRAVHLHAAIEQEYLGPLLIVGPGSAAKPISNFVKSPIVAFPLDHAEIAKPRGAEPGGVYGWVLDRVGQEYQRISTWKAAHAGSPPSRQLCEGIDHLPE